MRSIALLKRAFDTAFALRHRADLGFVLAPLLTDTGEAVPRIGSDDVGDGWNRAELEEHVRDENSTFTWLLEPMMQQCGFEIVDATYSDDGFFAKYLLKKR